MVVHVDFICCILLLPCLSFSVTKNRKIQEGIRSIVNTNWICVCVHASVQNPHTYIGICICACMYMCTVTTLLSLRRQALWRVYFMKQVIYPQCAWLAGFACMDISYLRSEQWLVKRGNDITPYQNQMALKVTVGKQWQESNACNLGRKPRTVN